ncbi:hypothetical protein GF324_13075, partial [bacterium]|nr:hypothetical protein [bacterium]
MELTQLSETTRQRLESFDRAFTELEAAAPFAKARYQTQVYRTAGDLMDTMEGMEALLTRSHRFDEAGVFHGGP